MRPEQLLAKTRPDFWSEELELSIKEYAQSQYPYECCAYVIDGKLFPVENIAIDKLNEFELYVDDAMIMERAQGFIHSHPDGNLWPSAADMQTQIQWNKPFGIVTCTEDSCSDSIWWGDHTLAIQLEERPFIHGIFDCYSLVRAERFQRTGEIMPDVPRNFEWWESGPNMENLYDEKCNSVGLYDIPSNDSLQPGDVILMKIHTEVNSHAAIYLGNDLILHHLRDRFSRVEHASSWKKFNEKVVRYKDS